MAEKDESESVCVRYCLQLERVSVWSDPQRKLVEELVVCTLKSRRILFLEMEETLINSVLVENTLRELIGMHITKTVAETKKRTVYREGLVFAYAEDAWLVCDDNTGETFEVTFDDFIMNKIFVHNE